MELIKPYSEQAERAILGTVIVNPKHVSHVVSVLVEEDFFLKEYREIFKAIKLLYSNKDKVDLATIANKLNDFGTLESVGGVAKLVELSKGVVTENVTYYVEILKDKTNLRQMASLLEKYYDNFDTSSTQDTHLYLDKFEKDVLAITRARSVADFRSAKELITTYNELLNQNRLKTNSIPTGFNLLDTYLNGGWKKGQLIVLGARAGVGKTALGLNFAVAAAEKNYPVAFFSLEMPNEELINRMISMVGRIDNKKITNGGPFSDSDAVKLDGAAKKIQNMPIYFDDTPAISLLDFLAKVRKLKGENPALSVVIVDYLTILRVPEGKNGREREVAKIVIELKALARELEISVIALAQLNRNADPSKSKTGGFTDSKPQVRELRESGQIEQEADVIILIYREGYYNTEEQKNSNDPQEVELLLRKNRNGAPGTVEVIYSPNIYRFDNKQISAG